MLRHLLLVFLLVPAGGASSDQESDLQSLDELSKGEVYSAENDPDGKGRTHVPILGSLNNGRVATIIVPRDGVHQIWATDQNDVEIFHQEFGHDRRQQLSAPAAQGSFEVPDGVTHVTLWAHCNLHGLWKSAERAVHKYDPPVEHEL